MGRILRTKLVPWRSARWVIYPAAGLLLYFNFLNNGLSATRTNGFDLTDSLVPVNEIHHGGPPRDGIPAIDAPKFISADKIRLRDQDRVLGLVHRGYSRAYPVRILDYHEIVNDRVGGEAVVVSYCPLCGTGMAFSAHIGGKDRSFGVSGLLYNSDVLLYDRESESLWSQIMRKAVSGKMKGQMLNQLPLAHTTWKDWRTRYPGSKVLSEDTGHSRNYARSPYQGYERSQRIWFPVANTDRRYHPKELVIGLELNGKAKVYPFVELAKHGETVYESFAGQDLQIEFDAANRTGRIRDKRAIEIPSTIAYWFAWMAFHPDSEVYQSK